MMNSKASASTPADLKTTQDHGEHKYLDSFIFNLDEPYISVSQLLAEFRPEWQQRLKEEELIIKKLAGGITNVLLSAHFKVNKEQRMLFRIYGHETDKIIDRQAELKTLSTLHRHSCAGQVYGVFRNGMSYEYISGEILTVDNIRDDHICRLLIDKLVQLHCVYRAPGQHAELKLFDKIWQFLSLAPTTFKNADKQKHFQEYFPQGLEQLRQEVRDMQGVMAGCTSPIVFCHNDLLPGNILFYKPNDAINFIDFEYAGLNYQAYDIANHFNEYAGVEECDYSRLPSQSYQEAWLKLYLQAWKRAHKEKKVDVKDEEVKKLYQLVQKFTLVSHLLWITWTFIQAENSDINFDFLRYGHIRFQEYKRRRKEILG